MNDCQHCDCDGSVTCCICGQEKPAEDVDEHERAGCVQDWHRCAFPHDDPDQERGTR